MTPDTHPLAGSPGNAGSATRAGGQGPGIPVTGKQYEVSAGDYGAVVTQLGAGLRELSHGGIPLVFGYEADELPPGAAGELLTPWPNRVDHGRYEFNGVPTSWTSAKRGRVTQSTGSPGSPRGCRCGTSRTASCCGAFRTATPGTPSVWRWRPSTGCPRPPGWRSRSPPPTAVHVPHHTALGGTLIFSANPHRRPDHPRWMTGSWRCPRRNGCRWISVASRLARSRASRARCVTSGARAELAAPFSTMRLPA